MSGVLPITNALIAKIFDDLTNRFSQAEVPLVHEVIPMLERLEHMMVEVSRDTELSAIVRVAALAALQVIGKYYALTDDNEVYRIAISTSFGSFLVKAY
jgi:hypothetical protein